MTNFYRAMFYVCVASSAVTMAVLVALSGVI